jgi:DNA-binding NarL/FixJ family response regulator
MRTVTLCGCSFRRSLREGKLSHTRILLADDNANFLEIATGFLEPTFEVIGAVQDGQSLLNAAARLKPDVLVIDICMPILSGIEAAERLWDSGNKAKIVFLTLHDDPDFLRASLAAGAMGYVIKSRIAEELVFAVQEALADRIFISPSLGPRT